MKPFYLLLALCCNTAFGQITVDGTSTQATLANNAPAITVDEALTITTPLSIPQFTVKITGFSSGDELAINGSLPDGITASYNSTTGQLSISGTGTASQYQSILRNVTFRTSSSVTTTRTILFQAGDGTVQLYGGHYYKIINGSYTFSSAKTTAAALSLFGWQGYLSTITSAGENSFIYNSIGKGWLGASDEYSEVNAALGSTTYADQGASEGKWYWVTGPEKGTQFSNAGNVIVGKYASWNSGEPNNSNGEHFAENGYPNNGSWNDAQGGGLNNILVEFGTSGSTVDILHSRSIGLIATQLNIAVPSVPYQLHASAVSVDAEITGYSISTFTAGRVTISGNFQNGDFLTYTGSLPGEFSGTYNSTSGVLTFTTTSAVAISAWQTLFRNVKFNSTSNVVGDRTVTFSLGNLVAFNNGHFYEYISSTTNWDNAKTIAEARTYSGLHGYLVTITSSDENEFIRQKIGGDAWTGASDNYSYITTPAGASIYGSQSNSEGKWYWVTGPEKGTQMTTANAPTGAYPPVFGSAYNNWNLGEPNNNSTNEHAGTIYSTGTTSGKWNDLNGASNVGYVVEYGGLSTDPLLQLTASRVINITNILPVHDLQFNVSRKDADVNLAWSTSAEENTKKYDVLHSVDGTNFSVLSSVTAIGNSSTTTRYSWLHAAPGTGTHYYKLAQYDIDGSVHYSEVRTIQISEGRFNLYPTLAITAIRVSAPSALAPFTIGITNAAGTLVFTRRIHAQSGMVDISGLTPGVYFAEIVQGNERQVFRFVKN